MHRKEKRIDFSILPPKNIVFFFFSKKSKRTTTIEEEETSCVPRRRERDPGKRSKRGCKNKTQSRKRENSPSHPKILEHIYIATTLSIHIRSGKVGTFEKTDHVK